MCRVSDNSARQDLDMWTDRNVCMCSGGDDPPRETFLTSIDAPDVVLRLTYPYLKIHDAVICVESEVSDFYSLSHKQNL